MNLLEMPGIEPGAFHMQSERATTALHPLIKNYLDNLFVFHKYHKKMPILLIFFGTKKIHYVKEKNISCYAASQHKDSKKK